MTDVPSFGTTPAEEDADVTPVTQNVPPAGGQATDEPWHVKSADGRRTLFSGLEEDARNFVHNNFPRVHVEPGNTGPGSADVHLHNPSGGREQYNGGQWAEVQDK